MSENKHTPEPWYCENCGEGFDIFDSNDHSIIDGSFGLIECESNARRIVACVNACAGSPTDALEEMQRRGLTFGQLAFRHARLQQQRDELLAALEKIAGFTLSKFMGPHDMALECVTVACAAIASVK